MRIGVLAVQGAFVEHERALTALGASCFEIRERAQALAPMDGLVLPGGESTAMGKLLREGDMLAPLRARIEGGLAVLGTCAGMILLARTIENDARRHLATMDITVRRNAYGRQLDSFCDRAPFEGVGEFPLTFIRAPQIVELGQGTRALCRARGRVVAARQENQLACAFHPELTGDWAVHRYFLEMASGTHGRMAG